MADEFLDDFDALSQLFKVRQFRQEAEGRASRAKNDLKNAKEIESEILRRIDAHVSSSRRKKARKIMIDEATSAEGLRQLRMDLGMDEFGKKKGDDAAPPEE